MKPLIFIFRQLHAVVLKIKLIFDMQFSFLPVGVKWKVVKNVHCPLLLINTGLMSIGALTKKLLKNEENMHFPHGPLLKAPQRASLMHA